MAKRRSITPEQFNTFINTNHGKTDCDQIVPIEWRNWANIRSVEEEGMRKLRQMVKSAPKEEQIALRELIDLKEKGFIVIYNYVKKHR